MKQHTNNFKTALKTLGRELDVKITYTENNETQMIELSDIINVSPIINGGILKSVMKQLELELKVLIPQNTLLNVQIGLKVGNSFEYMNYGNFIVRDEPTYNADMQSYTYICYDKMLHSMVDYEDMNIIYPITIRNYINAICTHLGLTFKDVNNVFANYDKEIKNELYLDTNGKSLGYTFRDVLDELAQVTASTICINEETDELEIRYVTETNDSIDEEFLKDINIQFKDKYGPINLIVLSRADADNIYYPNEIPANPCEIKIVDNQILNWDDRETYMPDIYNKLNGLEYYINDFSSIGILWYELCDMYRINIGEDSYKCVLLNDEVNVQQGLEELIYTNMPEESVTDYHTADTSDRKVKQTIFQVNKQEGQIQSIVSEIGDRSQKTTTITQDIDGIQSAVEDIEDLTNTVSGLKTVNITDAYPNENILELHIYGNNSVFSYLYPADDLYPDDNLLPYGDSKIRFYNSKEDRTINLGIMDVLRQNTEVRDEVVIDYQGNVSLIRRVNKNGTTKPTPEVTELGQLHFTLVEGTNTFEIVNYTAPIEVKYAMKSTLTDIFATRAEMNSEIQQTAESIDINVNKKLRDYTTHQETEETVQELNTTIEITAEGINTEVSKKVGNDEVISKINQSAEAVGINANKINLTANDVINLLAGNEINLSSKNITIKADDMLINNQGMSFLYNNAIIGRFVTDEIEGDSSKRGVSMDIANNTYFLGLGKQDAGGVTRQILAFYNRQSGEHDNVIQIGNSNWNTWVDIHNDMYVWGYVSAANLYNRSLESLKKDINKSSIKAIDEVKNTDIYNYRLKEEKENCQKHYGIVIGDKYNYSKEIVNKENNAVDLYSMISILWKAVQEQQEQIEQLQKEIKEMKGEK